jgi:uncharacterized membrane protein YccC
VTALSLGTRWRVLGDWLDAADPGAVRRNHATRAALAALTAWLTVRTVVGWLAGRPMPAVGLYAVAMCFIGALVIVDARRAERQVTQLLSIAMVAVGLLLAGLLNGSEWYYRAVLLALIFASYAVRQRGLRPGELVLVLTMSLYFAEGSGAAWGNLAWFLFAAAVGLLSLWLWQFVLLPYDPRRSLRNSVEAFYRRAATLVGAVEAGLAAAPALAPATTAEKDPARRLRQVKLSRHVIEEQFPGALAPGGWTKTQLSQLQLALFNAEQGLARMVEGANDPSHLANIPAEIRTPLGRSLQSLQEALVAGSSESMSALAAQYAALQTEVRAYADAALGPERADTDAPPFQQAQDEPLRQTQDEPAPWVAAALRLIGGSIQVAQSAVRVQRLAASQSAAGQQTQSQAAVPAKAANRLAPPRVRLFGNLHMHPTTVLGIQAVVATGLAMLAARLLNVDHSNWVFWTAFAVIAGSTGESLRKMMMRVIGTVAGATIGVALALATPDNTVLVALVATACIFLTIYFWPISYPQMVFWLNIGFVMVYARLGAQEMDVLFARPSTTLLGALVAALVVVFVFPIRTADRFKAAAARFLDAVDGYVAAFVDAVTGGVGQPLDAAQAQLAAAYAQVEQTLPGVAYENNPMLQAQSPITQQATRIAALEAEVSRLAEASSERFTAADSAGAWMRAVQARIHADIQTITPLLSGEKGQAPRATGTEQAIASQRAMRSWMRTQEPLADPPHPEGARQGQFRTSGGPALIRIRDITSQLAAELGASGEAPQHAGAS